MIDHTGALKRAKTWLEIHNDDHWIPETPHILDDLAIALVNDVIELAAENEDLKRHHKDFARWEAMADKGAAQIDENKRLIVENECLTVERDLAIAHDQQHVPTAEAYELACKALKKSKEENEKLKRAIEQEHFEIDQLVAALYPDEFPRYCDDQANFPRASETDGRCTGEHVTVSLIAKVCGDLIELRSAVLLDGPASLMVHENQQLKAENSGLQMQVDGFDETLVMIRNKELILENKRLVDRIQEIKQDQNRIDVRGHEYQRENANLARKLNQADELVSQLRQDNQELIEALTPFAKAANENGLGALLPTGITKESWNKAVQVLSKIQERKQ